MVRKIVSVAIPVLVIPWLVSVAAADSDFVCKIRAAGGDYTNLAVWEAAIESDLTAAGSQVFRVSSFGSYINTDDGTGVTFSGGGTGLLKHINTASNAYVVNCSGTILTGTVNIPASGNSFVISDTGQRIGLAVAECYHDWTNGLNHNNRSVVIDGWTANTSHYVVVRAPAGQRHNGIPRKGSGYAGFALEINDWNSNVLTANVPYTRVSGIIARNLQSDDFCFSVTDDCVIEGCIALGSGGNRGIAYGRRCIVRNNLALDAVAGFLSGAYTSGAMVNNNTAIDCGTGFGYHDVQNSGGSVYLKNNLSKCSTDFAAFPGGGIFSISYCASADGTATNFGGTGNRALQTFTFKNPTNDDFHLLWTDTGAQNFGTNLTADAQCPFTDDIDGERRKGQWDIGADEIPMPGGTVVTLR